MIIELSEYLHNMSDSDYVPDSRGMFINKNMDEFARYKLAREKAQKQKTLETRVQSLEREVTQLKKIIQDIIGTD